MNKIKRKSIRTTLMAVCLMVAMLTSQFGQVVTYAAGEVTVTVSTLPALLTAIESAQDGDVIGIMYGLNVSADAVIGDPNKQITLKRMSDTSYLDVKVGNILFQNITFDGGGITSLYPFVMINNNVTFENAVFRNSVTNVAGGAVGAYIGEATFRNCLFENNRAIAGGHLAVRNDAIVNIENCTMKTGYAVSKGGAIFNSVNGSTVHITSSIITENEAGDFGGGVVNNGAMTIAGTKLYNNAATNGGADIGNTGWIALEDSLAVLVELFKDDLILPTGWVNDYDFEAGLFIPDIDPSAPNSLLKLDYDLVPTEVTIAPSSLGSAGDRKITGLISGKYYKITIDDAIYYAMADGSLTATESEASPLVGTEIIGLTNGETYMVEEFTPAPTTVLLDSASLGTASDGKIIGLESGKQYKITVDAVINYAKSDGSLTTSESEAGILTGTEIVGLTNGVTYLVEIYTAPVVPDPDPVVEEPTPTPSPTPTEEPSPTPSPTENPTPSENPTPTPTPEPTPTETPTDPTIETPNPTPTPTPVVSNPSSGGSSHSNHSSTTVTTVTPPKTKTPIVLASGKAVMDTTRTEYLLGYTDALMGNKGTVTRAQFAQIVYKLLTTESIKAVYSEKNSFKDVAADAWYNKAVSTIANAGLISKGSDGNFNPDKNITWGEMVTILAKFAKPNSEWKIITKHWAKDSINTAISYRWFEYNDQFNPDGEVTSVEMLDFINTMFTWTKQ